MAIDRPHSGRIEVASSIGVRPRINGVIFSQRLIEALEKLDIEETSRRLVEIQRIIESKREILDFSQCLELQQAVADSFRRLMVARKFEQANWLEELFSPYFKIL